MILKIKKKKKKAKGEKKRKVKEKQLKLLLSKVAKQFAKPDVVLIKHAIAFIRSKLAGKEFALIEKAYSFSKKKHAKQKRVSGEPYFNHLIETALILSDYDVDAKTIAAALLHDVLEDTDVKKEELEQEFGSEVAELVYALTKAESKGKRNAYLKKLLTYASKDQRVLLIKLADKLHNLRTIEYLPAKRRKEICKEALAFYAPLAEQFGLKKIQEEIEDICFSQLYPKEYKKLSDELKPLYKEKEAEIDGAIEILRKKLGKKPFSGYVFKKERKNAYHYFKKLKEGKTLEELYDYVTLVVVAPSIDACYEALKVIHNTFYPIPKKFKDYIALPSGYYRALHTSVIGPKGRAIKVYIRTKETDELEEKGITYWLKEKKKKQDLEKQLVSELLKLADSCEVSLPPEEAFDIRKDTVRLKIEMQDISIAPKLLGKVLGQSAVKRFLAEQIGASTYVTLDIKIKNKRKEEKIVNELAKLKGVLSITRC